MNKMAVETEEGRAIADALVILGRSLHMISIQGTGRHKYTPEERRDPSEFIRSAMSKLLERFRIALKIEMGNMYLQYGAGHDKTMKKNA